MEKPLSSTAASTIITNTAASTDANSTDATRTYSSSGCISTLFRRILRGTVLPRHRSDHERNTELCVSEKAKCSFDESILMEASGTPNLVAKLMGLGSIPIANMKNDLSTVTRSRSMNSAEPWKEFEAMQGGPRRTKSFREVPRFRELEDEKFYILIFEDGNQNSKLTSTEKISEKGFTGTEKLREGSGTVLGEVKHGNENRGLSRRESMYENNKENLIAAPNCSQKGGSEIQLKDKTNVLDQKGTIGSGKDSVKLREPLSKKRDSVGGKTRIKKNKDDFMDVETNETESNSKNSSPDSVLEDFQLPVNGSDNNPEVSSRLTSSKSRRILWEESESFRKLTSPEKHETLICNDQGENESNENVDGLPKIVNTENKIYPEILKESYKLGEEEMLKSNWVLKEVSKLEDYEEVGENLESGILDHMIDELVDQLAAF